MVVRMPKEWTGPSEYFAAGLYGNQNRKAVFRSVLPPEGHSRGFNAMEFEEAADLSLKKTKPNSYETREKVYPTSYGLDETMDLSTKWRAPPTSERKPLSSISSTLSQPASTSNTSESGNPERTSEHKRSKSSHHVRMLPRKRLHAATETHHNSASSCSSPDVIVLSDEERPRLNGHLNGYDSDAKNSDSEMPPLPPEKHWDPKELNDKRRQYKQLRGELRSEEMKLVLLKKLQQSQMIKENLLNQAAAAVATKMVPTGSRGASNTAPPPPLVRTGQIPQPQNKMLGQQLSHQTSLMSSPLMCSQSAHGGPPPLIGQRSSNSSSGTSLSSNLMSSMMRPSHNSSSRTPVTTPPNMVMGYNLHNLQQSVQSTQHQISMPQKMKTWDVMLNLSALQL
ncbi:unnamed protein product [Larinioides sclopetarius]|uniref:Transcriptional repressor p66 coiled-coil MBD2-interaction domain-containing protein n=1 Tax=Larinioides sclopetarius TaxID=280406 RepID=A0AAV2B429_9ARAC